jgi:hypothetical protein
MKQSQQSLRKLQDKNMLTLCGYIVAAATSAHPFTTMLNQLTLA